MLLNGSSYLQMGAPMIINRSFYLQVAAPTNKWELLFVIDMIDQACIIA